MLRLLVMLLVTEVVVIVTAIVDYPRVLATNRDDCNILNINHCDYLYTRGILIVKAKEAKQRRTLILNSLNRVVIKIKN